MDRHQTDSSGLVPLSPMVVPRFFSLDCAYVWCVYQLASLRLMPPRGNFPWGVPPPLCKVGLMERSVLWPSSLTPLGFWTHANGRGKGPPFLCLISSNRLHLNAAPACRYMAPACWAICMRCCSAILSKCVSAHMYTVIFRLLEP